MPGTISREEVLAKELEEPSTSAVFVRNTCLDGKCKRYFQLFLPAGVI
jgi:hypothetical protein